ncbi:unnamed protein product, partial [Mesorhabditis spiculigera]
MQNGELARYTFTIPKDKGLIRSAATVNKAVTVVHNELRGVIVAWGHGIFFMIPGKGVAPIQTSIYREFIHYSWQLKGPIIQQHVRKMATHHLEAQGLTLIAVLGSAATFLIYDPSTETLVNANVHTFAIEYYDCAFLKPIDEPTKKRPWVDLKFILIGNDGFEVLNLRIQGWKYQATPRARVSYFPTIFITERIDCRDLFSSGNFHNMQLYAANMYERAERIVFWVEKSLQEEQTTYYQGELIFRWVNESMGFHNAMRKTILTGNHMDERMQISYLSGLPFGGQITQDVRDKHNKLSQLRAFSLDPSLQLLRFTGAEWVDRRYEFFGADVTITDETDYFIITMTHPRRGLPCLADAKKVNAHILYRRPDEYCWVDGHHTPCTKVIDWVPDNMKPYHDLPLNACLKVDGCQIINWAYGAGDRIVTSKFALMKENGVIRSASTITKGIFLVAHRAQCLIMAWGHGCIYMNPGKAPDSLDTIDLQGPPRPCRLIEATSAAKGFAVTSFYGENEEFKSSYIEFIHDAPPLKRPMIRQDVRKMVTHQLEAQGLTLIAALGSVVTILIYDPSTETLVNASDHTFAIEYYDCVFLTPTEAPTKKKPWIQMELVLIGSEGFEILHLRIQGWKYQVTPGAKVSYFPSVFVTMRVVYRDLFFSDNFHNMQLATGDMHGRRHRYVFWVEKSFANDQTIYYQGALNFVWQDGDLTYSKRMEKAVLSGNHMEARTQISFIYGSRTRGEIVQNVHAPGCEHLSQRRIFWWIESSHAPVVEDSCWIDRRYQFSGIETTVTDDEDSFTVALLHQGGLLPCKAEAKKVTAHFLYRRYREY